MALFTRLAGQALPRGTRLGLAPRHFSAGVDPYKTLGLQKNATKDDVKEAYKREALKWHPDRNAENKDTAQDRFANASNAYEILKDPEKRQEYDLTGRVGGQGQPGHPGGFPGGFPGGPQGGFQGNMSQADAERMFRQVFGGGSPFGGPPGGQGEQGMFEQMQQQMHMQRQHQQQMQRQGAGCGSRARPPGMLVEGLDVRIRHDEATIHRASRDCGIDADHDERRADYAGLAGTIAKVDPEDQSIKVRVMVSPGRAAELWYGAGAVWDPESLEADAEVLICSEADNIHRASREVGIDAENDERRARCAGKRGSVTKVDHSDQSVKVRVIVKAGRADELWFGMGAIDPPPMQVASRRQGDSPDTRKPQPAAYQ